MRLEGLYDENLARANYIIADPTLPNSTNVIKGNNTGATNEWLVVFS
jgi:hypothetical protein